MPYKIAENGQHHFTMVRNFYMADMITILNGICGCLSIFSCMEYLLSNSKDRLYISICAMFMGLFFDFLDGRIARWRKSISLLGQELDSLADLITFGLAPVVFGYTIGMRTLLDIVILTYFVVCGIARLARYNSTVISLPKDSTGKIEYFEGTPIPSSLVIIVILACCVHFDSYLGNLPGQLVVVMNDMNLHPIVLLYGISGTLMISKTLHIPKP
ncbi:hypothetical protein BDB01DRAFT_843394 [Pilobolus umbonatus]|nr:hypothetical protein BDB01DRAFT_843394 [Pilobolus umbonatus]